MVGVETRALRNPRRTTLNLEPETLNAKIQVPAPNPPQSTHTHTKTRTQIENGETPTHYLQSSSDPDGRPCLFSDRQLWECQNLARRAAAAAEVPFNAGALS